LDAFYKLHVLTRRRHGVPVQPFHYFQMLRDEILESGKGFISLAYKDNTCIAGGLYLHWNKTLVYKYAASTELGRQLYANDPIVWNAICWGCANGYTTFDWGRSDVTNEGLRRFKNRWGSDESPLYYSRNHELVSNGLEQKMTPIMNVVINKSPLWVCRFSGELLYRYIG
jgi:lipid II:glycine glycyltransferase (peptidoglycan interpeptide bridge formation enzyme)